MILINILVNKENGTERNVEEILTSKKKLWENEDEYRFLKQTNSNFEKIDKITAIYFGTPYDNLLYSEKIKENRKTFINYGKFKEKIIKIAKNQNIQCFDVKIENNEIIKLKKNLWKKNQ